MEPQRGEQDEPAVSIEPEADEAIDEPTPRLDANHSSFDVDPVWQARVEQRAGIAPTAVQASAKPLPALEELYDQVQASIRMMQQQGPASNHQDYNVVQQELAQHQSNLQSAGSALEYYQNVRYQLAAYVGALREIHPKVVQLQHAFHQLEHAQQEYKDEEDAWYYLKQAGLLVTNETPEPQQQPTVDEFGRNLTSQADQARDKRWKKRLGRTQSSDWMGDESDPEGDESLRERHTSLRNALDAALSAFDEDFTSLPHLVDIFRDWHHHHPHDYEQTYAGLSLADLASVLVNVELCALNDPWDESGGYNEARWMTTMHKAQEEHLLTSEAMDRLMERSVVPSIQDLFEQSGYDLVSRRQARKLSSFVRHALELLDPNSLVALNLKVMVTKYIATFLANRKVAIVRREAVVHAEASESVQAALRVATVEQMHRLKKILINVLEYWGPLLKEEEDFIDSVLHFTSTKFVFLISSLQGFEQPQFAESPAEVFGDVYKLLETMPWLDRPEWLVQAAPIRAAANVYTSSQRDVL